MWLVPCPPPIGTLGAEETPSPRWPKEAYLEKVTAKGRPRGDRPRRRGGTETQEWGGVENNDPKYFVGGRHRGTGDWVGDKAGEGWG